MAVTVAQLKVTVEADTGKLKSGLSEANKEVKGFGASATKSAGDSGTAFLAFTAKLQIAIAVIKTAVSVVLSLTKAASDLSETVSKADQVFGKSAQIVKEWSKTSATALGMSRQQALETAASYGNLLTAMKFSDAQAARMSTRFVQLAADMASFNNTSMQEALDALRSGLVGESEPLRRFGVTLNEATLQTKAFEMGLISSKKEGLEPATKAAATYQLVLEQTAKTQGDFKRTSEGFANQQRILNAQWEDFKALLGQGVQPVVLLVIKGLREMMTVFTDLVQRIQAVGVVIRAMWDNDFLYLRTLAQTTGSAIAGFFTGAWKAVVSVTKVAVGLVGQALVWVANRFFDYADLVYSQMAMLPGEGGKVGATHQTALRAARGTLPLMMEGYAGQFSTALASIEAAAAGAKMGVIGGGGFKKQVPEVDSGKKGKGAGARTIEDQLRNLGVLDFFGEITKQFEDAMGLSAKTLSEMFNEANDRREQAAQAMRKAIELITKARNAMRNRSGNEEAYVYGRPSRAGEFGVMNGLDPNTDSEGFQRGRRGEGFKGQPSPMESFRLSFLRNSRSVGRRFLSDFLGDSRQRRQAFRGLFEDIRGAMIETLNQKGRDLIKPALDSIGKTLSDAIMQAAKAVHVSVGALLSAAYQLFSVMQRKKKFGLLSVVGGVAGAFLGGVGGALAGYNFGNALDNGDATGALFGAASAYAGGAFGGGGSGRPTSFTYANGSVTSRAAGVNISIGQQIINDRADVARVSEEMAARVSRRVNSRVG